MSSLRERVTRLTEGATTTNLLAKTCFVDWVEVCCPAEEYAEHEPSDCGGPGFITIRAASRARYCAKRDELKADGWTLLEG